MRRKSKRATSPNHPQVESLSIGTETRYVDSPPGSHCPKCGQRIDHSQDAFSRSGFTEDTTVPAPINRTGRVAWFLVALLAICAAALIVGRDSSESVQDRENPQNPGEDPTDNPSTPGDDSTTDTAGYPDEGVSASEIRRREILEAVSRHYFAQHTGGHQFAYLVSDGEAVALVDPAVSTESTQLVNPSEANMDDLLEGYGSFVMYDRASGTYGFVVDNAPSAPSVHRLSATWGLVIVGADDHLALVFDEPPDPARLFVGNSSGVFMVDLEVPLGATLLEVPGLGVLVTSVTGETFVTTQVQLTRFSEWPVVAANAVHHVEIRCTDTSGTDTPGTDMADCIAVLVDRASGETASLPRELVDNLTDGSQRLTISPDGGHLLLTSSDVSDPRESQSSPTSHLYDVAASSLVRLEDPVPNGAAWSPDSKVVAWLDPMSAARLSVLRVENARINSVDLTVFGAPAPSSDALLLLPPKP